MTASASSAPSAPTLAIERIAVRDDRLSILVRIAPAQARYTTPAFAQRLAAFAPTLPHHTCINDEGSTFASVMDHTSVPHALEHAIIDEQVRLTAVAPPRAESDDAAATAPFLGTTEWLDEREGLARVEVSFQDDLLALQALRTATALVRDCLTAQATTDQEDERP